MHGLNLDEIDPGFFDAIKEVSFTEPEDAEQENRAQSSMTPEPTIAHRAVTLLAFLQDVRDEVITAEEKHARLNSLHEAYAVILEELDELWDECRLKRQLRNQQHIYTELVQIAAMAARTATDLGIEPQWLSEPPLA